MLLHDEKRSLDAELRERPACPPVRAGCRAIRGSVMEGVHVSAAINTRKLKKRASPQRSRRAAAP